MKNFIKDGDGVSSKEYAFMTEEEKKLMSDLFMSGINYDGNLWVTYDDAKKVVNKIILGRAVKDYSIVDVEV